MSFPFNNSMTTAHPQQPSQQLGQAQREKITTTVSFDEAKGEFIGAVQNAIECLEKEHQYSRRRATRALLQEITSLSSSSEHLPPSDDKVFEVCQKHGLGWDQAIQALLVARTVESMSRSTASVTEALASLTERIKNAELSQHGAARWPWLSKTSSSHSCSTTSSSTVATISLPPPPVKVVTSSKPSVSTSGMQPPLSQSQQSSSSLAKRRASSEPSKYQSASLPPRPRISASAASVLEISNTIGSSNQQKKLSDLDKKTDSENSTMKMEAQLLESNNNTKSSDSAIKIRGSKPSPASLKRVRTDDVDACDGSSSTNGPAVSSSHKRPRTGAP